MASKEVLVRRPAPPGIRPFLGVNGQYRVNKNHFASPQGNSAVPWYNSYVLLELKHIQILLLTAISYLCLPTTKTGVEYINIYCTHTHIPLIFGIRTSSIVRKCELKCRNILRCGMITQNTENSALNSPTSISIGIKFKLSLLHLHHNSTTDE
jgi:hypothetical protein